MKNPNENLHENPCWQCKQMIMLWTNVNDNEKHKNIITTLISSLKLPKKERWCKITINSHHLPRVWQHLVQGRRNAVEGTLTSPPHPMWALLSKLLYIHAYVIYVCVNIYNNIYMCVCKCIYIYMLSTRGHFLRIIFGLSSRSLTWIPAGCHGGKSGDEVVFNKGAQQVGAQRSFWREMCPLIGIYISTISHYEDCHFGMDAHKPQSMFWP